MLDYRVGNVAGVAEFQPRWLRALVGPSIFRLGALATA
jgi:hypothetical protein